MPNGCLCGLRQHLFSVVNFSALNTHFSRNAVKRQELAICSRFHLFNTRVIEWAQRGKPVGAAPAAARRAAVCREQPAGGAEAPFFLLLRGTGHLKARSGEALGGPGGVEKAGGLSLPPGSPGRGLLLCASGGEGPVSACLHALTPQTRGAHGRFLPVTSQSLEPAASTSSSPGRSGAADAVSASPGVLVRASPLPPGAVQCPHPQGARAQPGHFHTTQACRGGGTGCLL